MWSTQARYDWYRANMGRWSSLVWTLCYLGVTPSMVARMMLSLHGRTQAMAKSKMYVSIIRRKTVPKSQSTDNAGAMTLLSSRGAEDNHKGSRVSLRTR